jgi:tetratricopeptide (TPR) repeat protein
MHIVKRVSGAVLKSFPRTFRYAGILLAVCATALPSRADEGDRVCAHAVELHRAGDVEGAIAEYRSCLSLKPNAAPLRSNLGAALAQSGRYQEAIQAYEEALKTTSDPRLRRNLALAYYKSGAISKAIAELEALHSESPGDLQITLLLADCRLQNGEFHKIVELLAPLENDEREKRTVAYLLGTALIRNGEIAKGQRIIDRILREGDSAEARFLVATAAFVNGDYPAAVKGFASAIELNPDVPSLQSYYGQALLLTGDPDAAAAAFRKELLHNPYDFESNLKLGSILQFRRQHEEALPYLRRSLTVRPASLEARYAVAQIEVATGNLPEARAAYEQLTTDAPDFAPAHTELAKIYDRLNRKTDAAKQRTIAARLKQVRDDTGLLPVGTMAPDFSLSQAGSNQQISLAALRKQKPVVLVFGSYTCPKFRFDSAQLNKMYDRYHEAVTFLLVYVQEAHSDTDWKSTANDRENISLQPATAMPQKIQYAATCTRKLPILFPAVVDGMDRKVESAYKGWPSAIYLVGKDGQITYSSRLGEQEFSAMDLERAISKMAVTKTEQLRKKSSY